MPMWGKIWPWIAWFNDPPWGFIGLLAALAGLIMAFQPFLQMVYGRPLLSLKFCYGELVDGYHALSVEIYNRPIGNRALRWLGVRRECAEGIVMSFEILNCHDMTSITGKIWPLIHTGYGPPSTRFDLPGSSEAPAGFAIIKFHPNDHHAMVEKTGLQQALPVGLYIARFMLSYGENTRNWEKQFIVRKDAPYAEWKS